jgi:hypothetical protein
MTDAHCKKHLSHQILLYRVGRFCPATLNFGEHLCPGLPVVEWTYGELYF